MKLRKKGRIIILITSTVLLVVLLIITNVFFTKEYIALEEQSVEENVNRAKNALHREISTLCVINEDWSSWDESYQFVQDVNKSYVRDNLNYKTLLNLKCNIIVFLDTEGNIKYAKTINLKNKKEISLPKELLHELNKKPYFIKNVDDKNCFKGILSSGEIPIMITLKPILTSTNKGPVKGTLILGKFIDKDLIDKISGDINLPITITPITSDVSSLNKTANKILIEPLSSKAIKGSYQVEDIYGRPCMFLSITMERGIYNQGENFKELFLFLLTMVCLTFMAICLWFLEIKVLTKNDEHEVLLNTIPCMVCFKDINLRYIAVNEKFEKTFNISREFIRGKTDLDLFTKETGEVLHNEDLEIVNSGTPKLNSEIQMTLPSGERVWFSKWKSPYRNQNGEVRGIVGVFLDITTRKQMEDKLHYAAYFDSLTTLPNRELFNIRVNELIKQRDTSPFSILCINVDKFKMINDILGHSAGDEFIKFTALRLLNCIRNGDTIARLGGDEFVILLLNNKKEFISKVCSRILESVKQQWVFDNQKFYLTASIGIAIYPKDGGDALTLLKNANMAMNMVKEQGKNNYQFYKPILEERAFEELYLENGLRSALKNNEFVLYYQPQVDIGSGKIIGIEALIRWNRPNYGIVLPGKFIPYAEKSELIFPIGEWVLRESCRRNKLLQDLGYEPIVVAVNISNKQFEQKNLLEVINQILKETELDPKWLEIEITESAVMNDLGNSLKILRSIKKLGVKISLDDFGIGYSSLTYLSKFPIDKLKIDKSFIDNITTNSNSASIVKTIVELSKDLQMKVIAEGVEEMNQLEQLKKIGCDEIQGYIFSKPLPIDNLMEMLKK